MLAVTLVRYVAVSVTANMNLIGNDFFAIAIVIVIVCSVTGA